MTELSSDIHPKLSITVIEQLQRKHICTVSQFIDENSEKLATFSGLSLKDILDVRRNILKKYGGVIRSATDLFKIEMSNITPTDLPSLDNLLKGGLYPGQIYEICGISASGKTQLCLTIASNVALRPNSLIRYIDTKRDFCGSRIKEILLRKNCNDQVIDEAMEHIRVCNVYNLHQLFKVLRWLTIALKEEIEARRTRIIVIDSLPGIIFKFSSDHKLTTALNHLANICHFLANEFHLSIITVNLITQWNLDSKNESTSTAASKNRNDVTPTLGKYWAGVPNTRLLITKIGLDRRKICTWHSFQLENLSCTLTISDSGMLCS
ncbi:DNA repair protein RAD51 homolog 4 [Hylaeus volcanicus]|uniref:DNA repair protein RAD51 homolog 4 n=1 Tax=Hylaeus volcanicus TaxID=313075 RepID=UPI0023B7EFBD|nr:DNA repair protein RAD51 homolog 4 [Hylaeus volcanicus]XP_053987894.1 DNA repair protein RAD51 homolog 4 [Hylaeus volcanicus]XP_053987895.1 DNA repair protein RAD51 homolog 4 [Hylaeus volcanicus]XP_053987897.1 DNA repair protein RAD51 homolog 4 [Hylaeus volcanicus]